ncbi:peptide-methionine (S)-S-oxide reductase MsrA [Brevibacterium sp. UMB1308A]|uniref:peptide-methionine (S)-S-oxide reductase MsrA n=1 Tax=Brevibacterium sp. UMB1308A TaxID=3050608 RepID=UPI00254EAF4D|nr:peptide-methionine (S)-S-oxide reductase MsrA [Brevibacterium sp. UMB1308A]MDK8347184.1 peptide-methionine (S)-S-oxide reductase MsrA [Brevibacterium sp. UMB1308B]MDK8713374.1 peptide-methionine (S)-S-oxide reductase MsrA [Brevibacterium sp. UMB1308A]
MTQAQPQNQQKSQPHTHHRTITLANGCFWCFDAVVRRARGVIDAVSGYIGGHVDNPTYHQVCSGTTGHAEAVAVTYDPDTIPEHVILGMFFTTHDPTSLNRQGHDVGTQYRSAMFYQDQEQKERFQHAIDQAQQFYDRPIVTTLEPLSTFFPADNVHQDFYTRNPGNGYCSFVIDPKLAQARKQWADWIQ